MGPIAQSVEQRTFNPWVDGSSPSGPTPHEKKNSKIGWPRMLKHHKRQSGRTGAKMLRRLTHASILRMITLCLLFFGLFRKSSDAPTSMVFTLTPEQVYINSSPNEILGVLREDRFASRANFVNPMIEVRSLRTIFSRNINFTSDLPIYVLHKNIHRRHYLGIFNSINREISDLVNLNDLNIRHFKEYVFDQIVYAKFFSQQSKSIDLITTQSSFFKVPSAFRIATGQKKIMAWYSTNSKPIYATDDMDRQGINVEAFNEYVDEHWVWNEEDIKFLQLNGITNAHALGPIIFQNKIIGQKESNKFIITYFDVTPYQGNGGFYSEQNTNAVLENILQLVEVLNEKYPDKLVVQLKPKRKYKNYHAKVYVSLVKSSLKSKKIKSIPASANLYLEISKSDLVLAIPFTSPGLLARDLKVESFFISTDILGWDISPFSGCVPVIFHFEDLLNEVETGIQKKFKI